MDPPAEEPRVSKRAILTTCAVGGGFVALGMLMTMLVPLGAPAAAILFALVGGAVVLLVGTILGATSRAFSGHGRTGFALGAVGALFVLLFVLAAGSAYASASAAVCGAAVAGPGLMALRGFALFRDAML